MAAGGTDRRGAGSQRKAGEWAGEEPCVRPRTCRWSCQDLPSAWGCLGTPWETVLVPLTRHQEGRRYLQEPRLAASSPGHPSADHATPSSSLRRFLSASGFLAKVLACLGHRRPQGDSLGWGWIWPFLYPSPCPHQDFSSVWSGV